MDPFISVMSRRYTLHPATLSDPGGKPTNNADPDCSSNPDCISNSNPSHTANPNPDPISVLLLGTN